MPQPPDGLGRLRPRAAPVGSPPIRCVLPQRPSRFTPDTRRRHRRSRPSRRTLPDPRPATSPPSDSRRCGRFSADVAGAGEVERRAPAGRVVSISIAVSGSTSSWCVVSPQRYSGQFGLTDRATRQRSTGTDARSRMCWRRASHLAASLARQYFRLLPPAGRFPGEHQSRFTQSFFPQHLTCGRHHSAGRTPALPTTAEPAAAGPDARARRLHATVGVRWCRYARLAALKQTLTPRRLQPFVPQIIGFRRPINCCVCTRRSHASGAHGRACREGTGRRPERVGFFVGAEAPRSSWTSPARRSHHEHGEGEGPRSR